MPPPPPWAQIAGTLAGRIASGEYAGAIPSRAALAAEFGVAPGTAAKAIHHLAARGLICAVPGRSYSIRDASRDGAPADPRTWVRVADALRERIACGELKPWDQVPGRETLCREFGCSLSPVTKALTALEREGVIRHAPGRGYQVAGEQAPAPAQPWEWDPRDLRLWAPVARALADRVTSGELEPGAAVPPKGALARECGVSVHTAERALRRLAQAGMLRRVPGHAYQVSSRGYAP